MRDGLADELANWMRRGYPYEVVALLLGSFDSADDIVITQCVPVANQALDPSRHFVMDPQGWLTADTQAQSLGLDIVGMVHSHPDAPPYPSHADSASAALLGTRFVYLIAAVDAGGAVEMQAWRWDGQMFCEQRLQCR